MFRWPQVKILLGDIEQDGRPLLAPDDRALLPGALRPSHGMRLERAVGNSVAVDLAAALTVPVSFADPRLPRDVDPVTVMEALQAAAGRLDIFAQADAILADRWPSDLAVLLEPVLHKVTRPPPGHLFYPNAWVARSSDGGGGKVFPGAGAVAQPHRRPQLGCHRPPRRRRGQQGQPRQ